MNKIFLYDDLITKEKQNLINIEPIKSTLAIAPQTKLYNIHKQPILLNYKDITNGYGNSNVFGVLCEFEPSKMVAVLNAIDSYKGSSMSRSGYSYPFDLVYRSTIKVIPITKKQILNNVFKFINVTTISCGCYLGNTNNKTLYNIVKKDRHKRLMDGHCGTPFINYLKGESNG